ncbi:MAG TPA: TolC family protein [Steroidobacteraceae bacterium]|nr:TolC family protein [Steroidobacteraceae bacterium]
MSNSNGRMPCAVAIAFLTGGCAAVPLQQGRSNVDAMLQARMESAQVVPAGGNSADASRIESQITQWLGGPLTLENAQRIALLRNPRIRAEYARLGLTAAEVFEAGRLQNPTLGLSWLLPLGQAQGSKVDASAGLGITDLLLRGARKRMAAAQFDSAQQSISGAILDLVAQTRQGWFDCVAATQRVTVRRSTADAAQLAADLARQYHDAGNITQLELQLQRAEASQARIELQAAELMLTDARAALQRQLGLSAAQSDWSVPDSLPEIPQQSAGNQAASLQSQALQQRLDLTAARHHVAALQLQRDTVHRYRYVSSMQLGADFEREGDGSKRLGPAAQLSLPLFQQGQGAITQADAELALAEAEVVELENAIRSEVGRQLQRRELARLQAQAYREGLIPQREAIVARLQERANYMLADSFSVLTARQQEYTAYAGYVDAVLRYWTAHTELLRAMGSLRGTEEQP